MIDYTKTEAWATGVARAEEELARLPPDDGTLTVSLWRYPEWTSFKLCRQCHRERGSEHCQH